MTTSENAEQLRWRIASTAHAATGSSLQAWLGVIGPVVPWGNSWKVAEFRGDPGSNMVARRIAEEVRRHFPGIVPPPTRSWSDETGLEANWMLDERAEFPAANDDPRAAGQRARIRG